VPAQPLGLRDAFRRERPRSVVALPLARVAGMGMAQEMELDRAVRIAHASSTARAAGDPPGAVEADRTVTG
jgi:hypothetical protein